MRVFVGVCGSIAAYKAVELVRVLQQNGIQIDVAMTEAATRFVMPLTFASLTGRAVFTSLWQPSGEYRGGESSEFSIEHITAVEDIDALVIAPATANVLAKMAQGVADDFLTTIYLATKAPVLVAPAMNVNMWQHPATQANVRVLADRGVRFIEPESGYLACGMTGDGRLASVEIIADTVVSVLSTRRDFAGETVLITAGGTREPIDPVRFLGNRSSGKMGHALAGEAAERGARVILVTASSLPVPAGCEAVHVSTAEEMAAAVIEGLPEATVVIKAAAVSDYRARTLSSSKLRRQGPMILELEPTEDIVAKVVAQRRNGTLVIAFAAEIEDHETNARAKLLRKGADAIVVNDVSTRGLGFESDRNAGKFLTADSSVALPESSKRVMAGRVLDEILALRERGSVAKQTVYDSAKIR
ncbi:MAG TPA: bifunctional phosphopantothenoylcysteine decarboxylase/phosphopantothenate--cysteine ligase CoaBC [Acidobacteriaceae bacterium]